MNEKLYEMLKNMKPQELIGIMWGALDEMQAYNGRNKNATIVLAMGGQIKDNDNNRTSYSVNMGTAKKMGLNNPLLD